MPKPASEYVPDTQITPDPLLEKRTRRQFPMHYKLRIIAEADACKHGELGGPASSRETVQQSDPGLA